MISDLLRFFVFVLVYISPLLVTGQVLIDDFETDTDLTNWERIEGLAEVQGANEYSGALAIRLHRPDAPIGAQTTYLHRTFQENFGIYEMACYADGPVSDVQFIFQYLDAQNYYTLSCNPRNTDNPLLMLWKVVDGIYTVLDSIGPVVDLNKWFILRVERYCDGEISIYIDNDLKISVQDRSITDPGKIGLAAWAESTYFDDITFESINSDIVVDIEEFICSGRFYEIDTNRYTESGIYFDTLSTALGCDSIVRLKLTIVPHYLVTERDTICAHETYIFGTDTLQTSGRYNQALQSIHGCDSLVELNLIVLGSDTTITDTSICNGTFILFKNDTILQPGSYFDTIFSADGCFGITELRVSPGLTGLDLGEDRIVCFEDTPNIPLRVTGFDSISWFDGRNQETIAVSTPGTYWVEVFKGTCSSSDTIVFEEVCQPTTQIYIPNAFSPNADEVNDLFFPSIIPVPSNFRMTIFNRWGSLLYQTTVPDGGWDGRVNGEMEPSGVYVYMIEVDGTRHSGTVTLIR